VTGGLQDQCGFKLPNKEYIKCEDLGATWASNHDGRYKDHGEWVKPVWPKTRSILGSVQTPYIFDDRCSWEDAAEQIYKWYQTSNEEREKAGLAGREFCLDPEVGLAASEMCRRMMNDMDETINSYKPRKSFTMYKITPEVKKRKPNGINLTE